MNIVVNFVVLLLMLAVTLQCVRMWIRAVQLVNAGKPLIPHEPRREVPWGLADILVSIVFQMATVKLAIEWLRSSYNIDVQDLESLDIQQRAWMLFAFSVSMLASFGLTVVWLFLRYRPQARDWGLSLRALGSDIGLGIKCFIMLAPVVYGIQFLLVRFIESKHPLIELLKENPSPQFFLMSGFAAVLVAPVTEEFFFRLLLQGWMERMADRRSPTGRLFFGGYSPSDLQQEQEVLPDSSNVDSEVQQVHTEQAEPILAEESREAPSLSPSLRRLAIVGSATLFALAHFTNGPDPIPLFVLALGLGYLYQTTHRIVPCIVVHFLLNLCTIGLMWLSLQQESAGG